VSWRRIALADVAPSPWRNGGGETRELAAWPTSGDWTWRMSVATVPAAGSFSRFEGVQRWFAVLGGAGVRLRVDGSEHTLSGSSAPFCFDGASATQCELLGGTTQDFNLMLRQQKASARMKRLNGELRWMTGAAGVVALYAIDGTASVSCEQETLTVPPGSLVWRSVTAGVELNLSAGNALWMEIAL
jgi:uncharacterized protein